MLRGRRVATEIADLVALAGALEGQYAERYHDHVGFDALDARAVDAGRVLDAWSAVAEVATLQGIHLPRADIRSAAVHSMDKQAEWQRRCETLWSMQQVRANESDQASPS